MKLYNTLGRQIQDFKPIKEGHVKIYTCGPTVYDYQHIGNYSGYIYWDILVRLFKHKGLNVERVMNITDVGHLASDADEGEDKLEKGAAREGKTARQVADFYTEDFLKNMRVLDLLPPDKYAKTTDYIPQQIEIIKTLLDKDFAYQTEQAIYFSVDKLDDYGKLTGQKLSDKEVGARPEVVTDSAKKHPQDFALWFFAVGRFANHEMRWPSPWGEGFPGWHLECSAIIHAILGDPIDIHTGGVDHIGTHHTNEIAQTEAAFGHQLANYWLHNNHMMVDGQKMSKSLGNFITLDDLVERGYSPADFKMLVLQSHYRIQTNFTFEWLETAKLNLSYLKSWADQLHQDLPDKLSKDEEVSIINLAKDCLENDLDTSGALAMINGNTHKGAPSAELLKTIDELLGLGLAQTKDINESQKQLVSDREKFRKEKNWQRSDEIRDQLQTEGIGLNDTERGAIWYRI